jgi:hypothetical protein
MAPVVPAVAGSSVRAPKHPKKHPKKHHIVAKHPKKHKVHVTPKPKPKPVPIQPKPTAMTITCPPYTDPNNPAPSNQPYTFTGRLSPDAGGTTIRIRYQDGQHSEPNAIEHTVRTNADGTWSDTFTPAPEIPIGTLGETATALFDGNSTRLYSHATCNYVVR